MKPRLPIVVLAALLLLGGCSCFESGRASAGQCTANADCVPATCCHATACVAKGEGPNCSGVPCTRECRAGTLDCGGGCVCRSGACAAELNDLGPGIPTMP